MEMDSKVANQQGGKIAKRQEMRLETLIAMQDLAVGKRFEFRVLPLVPVKVTTIHRPYDVTRFILTGEVVV